MTHDKQSPLAGTTVRIKASTKHPQDANFGGAEFHVEDWWDRVSGGSWMVATGDLACMAYAVRSGRANPPTPIDDEVLYGKVGYFGHLVHVSEIEVAATRTNAEPTP